VQNFFGDVGQNQTAVFRSIRLDFPFGEQRTALVKCADLGGGAADIYAKVEIVHTENSFLHA